MTKLLPACLALLTPLLAGNGDTVGWNLEIEELQTPMRTQGSYLWKSQTGPGGTYVETKLRESILQRKNHTDDDFGSHLVAMLGVPDTQPPPVPIDKVGINGMRSFNLPGGAYTWCTTSPAPFTISPPNWTERNLASVGLQILTGLPTDPFYNSPTFWETYEKELGFDYSWDPRPSATSGARDKGPEEVQ